MKPPRFSIERRILVVGLITLILIWAGGMGYLYYELTHEIDELAPHLFPGQDALEHTEELREALATTVFYPLLAGLPLLSAALLLVIYTGFRPIRQLKKTIETQDPAALKQLFARTSDLVAREKRLTADAAHELRTPLATIQVNAQTLQGVTSLTSDQAALLNDLLAGCERAKRAIDQMLELARLDHDFQTDQVQPIHLTELVRQEIAVLLPLAQQKFIQVQLEAPEAIMINRREALIKTALSTLLSPAITFPPSRGQVGVTMTVNQAMAIIRIEDSGAGLSPDQIQRLGERFFRVDPNAPGTGLGWSIVRQCVELLRGQIHVLPNASLGGLLVELKLPL